MKPKNLEDICEEILTIDQKIRFVEIVFREKTCMKTRSGLESILTPSETEISIADSLARWETRKKLAHKLGDPLYAFAEYGKVKRLTIPVNHDGLILVSLDSLGFHEIILKEILEVKEMINWNLF